MPLTPKGEEIRKSLVAEYGDKHGEQILYAGKNKGTFTGIDAIADAVATLAKDGRRLTERIDAALVRKDAKSVSSAPKGLNFIIDADDCDGQLTSMLLHIKRTAEIGHSFNVVVDPGDSEFEKKFYIDGDGAFRIYSLKVKE